MNQLHDLLDLAAGTTPTTTTRADLDRGRTALSRTRRRRAGAGAAGLAVVGAVGVGLVRTGDGAGPAPTADPAPAGARETPRPVTSGSDVRLVSEQLDAGPYTFDATPEGWEVQGSTPTDTLVVPSDGSVSTSIYDFEGKLLITFDRYAPAGQPVAEVDGRTFWVTGDSGYTRVSTPTREGEPQGTVQVQFPDDTGWTRETMIEFLGGVTVDDSVVPGRG